MKLFTIMLMFFLTGCTYSITQVHTQGTATDVVDEDQKADPVVSTSVTVPLTP